MPACMATDDDDDDDGAFEGLDEELLAHDAHEAAVAAGGGPGPGPRGTGAGRESPFHSVAMAGHLLAAGG